MEKIEVDNLIEKIKRRKAEGDFKTASYIADKIDWYKVTDVNDLILAASVYEEVKNYQNAKNILMYAYRIAPIKKRLYYPLCIINIKNKEFDVARDLYIDFITEFPEDSRKYLLKYHLLKAKGASLEQQRRLLEEYANEEIDEEVLFELALINDKLNNEKEVLKYIDNIVDYFGVKKSGYGVKALELKRKYVTLTDEEEKLINQSEFVDDEVNTNEEQYIRKKNEKKVDVNDLRREEDKVSVPVEKIKREEKKQEVEEDLKPLDEIEVNNSHRISYTPDIESYEEEKDNKPVFLNNDEEIDKKEQLKQMINKLKKEASTEQDNIDGIKKEGDEEMRIEDSKLNLIVEAFTKEEALEIARNELQVIRKALRKENGIAKASAYSINEKGFAYFLMKLNNKDLIIENAGKLKNDVIDEIEEYIINKKGDNIIVLTDIVNNFDKMAVDREAFIKRFDIYSVLSDRPQEKLEVRDTGDDSKEKAKQAIKNRYVKTERIKKNIEKNEEEPIKKEIKEPREGEMTKEEFVDYCKAYAKSIDCVLEGKVIPALYEKIEELQEEGIPLIESSAINLIEDAADKAEKPGLFKRAKYDKEGCLILSENNFLEA